MTDRITDAWYHLTKEIIRTETVLKENIKLDIDSRRWLQFRLHVLQKQLQSISKEVINE